MAMPPTVQKFRQDRAIVDSAGRPTPEFLRNLNNGFDLINYLAAIQAAADAAQTAADNANAAAAAAQGAADNSASATALANSFPTGLTISAIDAGTDASITISLHDRVYATEPQTTVSVNAGSVTGLAYDTVYYIYYDQPSRAGGTVTYIATTDANAVAQIGNRHSVGRAKTPLGGGAPANGEGVSPPGGNYNEP